MAISKFSWPLMQKELATPKMFLHQTALFAYDFSPDLGVAWFLLDKTQKYLTKSVYILH